MCLLFTVSILPHGTYGASLADRQDLLHNKYQQVSLILVVYVEGNIGIFEFENNNVFVLLIERIVGTFIYKN